MKRNLNVSIKTLLIINALVKKGTDTTCEYFKKYNQADYFTQSSGFHLHPCAKFTFAMVSFIC